MMDLVNSNDQVEYLFHHLFLPPKLPGGDDSSASKTIFLTEFVLQSLQRFTVELPGEDEATVQPAISMLQTMRDTMDSKGFLDDVGVRKVLTALSLHNPASLFHVAAQNAGLLIRRLENSFYFETFELSPTNAAAMATKGRLVRQFPDTATKISDKDFRSEEFQEVLANTLVKMSYQRVAEAQPKARKARKDHHEDRETTNPQIVNELLTSFLRGVGTQVQVEGIRKNTREETSYNSSKLPWRRSPAWMLIRVGLHLTMSRLSGGSDDLYKRFMTYLMSQALLKANQAPVSSELLHVMMTKISHRLCKLKGLRDDKWLSTVHNIVLASSKTLNERWERIRNHSEEQLGITLLASTEMKDHLFFSLPQVDKFLTSISHRGNNNDTANFRPVAHVSSFNADSLPFVRMPHDKLYIPFSLAMIDYHSAAKDFYSSRPEGASRMILTIGEIWVAADRAALHNYPMLKEYDAEVPTKIWQALLLQSKEDMVRLQHLERYLMERKGISNRPSVFRSFGESMSFPVRYFQSSSMLQSKETMIEERAELDKQAKIREFYQLKGRYQDLMQQYNVTTCGYVYETTLGVRYLIHDPYCHRCPLKSQANNLKIMVHEWPLPTDTLKAQATVFELGIPYQFAEWRDITFYFIHDVLAFESFGECPDTFYSLDSYSALSPWRTSRPSRVHLLSEAKPHLETHRRENDISFSDVADAYVQNGLVYQYHDRTSGRFISPFTQSMAVSELCTFKLPDRAQALNPFLVHTWLQPDGETPNQVIASQYKCPKHMTLGEFKALAVLPYGYRLQWMSILTQLAMPTIDFNQEETAIFLLQISLQAGPNSVLETTRETHARLTDVEFGRQLLDGLSRAVSRIEKNWESHTALCSFTLLAIRFLSVASPQLSQGILGLLSKCRNISYQWMLILLRKVQDTADDTQRKEFFESTLDTAMICLQTFNVDDKHLKEILRDSKQASLFVESSIVIYNTTVANNKSQSSLQRIMEYRTQHTLHRTRSILVDEAIIWENECLDLAIKRSWSDFSRTTEWSLASTTCYWLETMSGLRQVDLNVLTGELLVNGAPLARLPRDYSMHEDYGKLFGSMILDVRPSDVPGMRFSATRPFLGYTVHFGMQGQDLLVHLNKTEPMLDLVPSRLLKGTVPNQLADNFVHWYHRKSKIIEFRKLHSHWAPDDKRNWRFTQDDGNWKLGRDDDIFLVAPSSELGKRIAMILDPLEAPLGLHLVCDTVKRVTEIRIPNLRLEFLLKSGDSLIESRQFRDMHIDSDQSTGTLVGFKSKLVLTSSREPASRTVLIPEGDVRYEMKTFDHLNKHTMVTVVHGSARRVQAYKLDDLLGRLVGSTRTESRLYLAYLHGLTSFCLPDPFIGRTGTEEALDILRSAVVRVPSILTEISYIILDRIASLSPTRSFYPKKEKLMQVVEWSSRLSYMSQNDRFYKAVLDILARCREICFLYPKHEVPDSPDHSVLHLVERAITRASIGHVSGFGAEEFTAEDDVTYTPRAQGSMSARAIRAQEIASRVYNTHCYVIERIKPSFADDFYQRLGAVHVVNARQVPHKSDMQYDSRWLQGTENFLSSDWCQIHYAFQKKRDWLNKFELMAWVATTSYSKHYDPQITQVLLMMAQSASVSAVPLPTEPSYDLSQGYVTVPEEIRRLAESAARPIASCPESSLSPLPNETPRQLLNRRKQQFEANRNRAIRSFNDQMVNMDPGTVNKLIDIIDSLDIQAKFPHQPERFKKAVHRYITQWELTPTEVELVERSRFFDGASIGRILLLRGLFAGGILAFALGQKRWRVNYGIDPHRQSGTKLAVPFCAKDSPTPRSEFSHPDVVITLTCLSYYYGGLDEESLFSAFRLLTKSDNARTEYHEWTRTAPTLPSSFKTLEGVNLRDRAQFKEEIYPHLRYSKLAIDYYLSHLVFGKEAKEFPHKLSASGWDLGKIKDHPTTGFSGTNDSRYVLPTDIKQLDLPEQKHTNALVLGYLLQSQNGVTLVPQEAKVLDVGAQVIDLNNLEFAKLWLARYRNKDNTQAVICFNEDDEIVVLDRSGKIEELETSPFAEQLDRCLVFLDESHTRGTDLKLPSNYRAVVTLGAGLTKDRLVQACMRMRKLGKGQSVEFCVPWEIEQKIVHLKTQEGAGRREVIIPDVLKWVITETCLDLRKVIPLWLNQGVRFSRQQAFWSHYQDDADSGWAEQFLEDEAQSLDQRYRPRNGHVNLDSFLDKADASRINVLRARCDDFGLTELHTASLQEEQERELSPETEQERQVERPPAAEPETHFISQSLRNWILKGSSSINMTLFKTEHKPAFQILKSTAAAQYFDVQSFPSSVRATLDFAKTVKGTFGINNNYSDFFQRPVQWILTGKCQAEPISLVIISPFEAQELLPLIERSRHVSLHLYAPRVNLAFRSLDHLQLYRVSGKSTADAIPRNAVLFLNLFSGQLYLSSFKDYSAVCDLLGLAWGPADDSVVLGPDGFIPPGSGESLVNRSNFRHSPVKFLRVLTEN
ncbi:unnamed protein product, partial [Fusarium langsethiae]